MPDGMVFFEFGTGWTFLVPLSLWLVGARKIITCDLNPLLNAALIKDSLRYISQHEQELEHAMGNLLKHDRMGMLLNFCMRKDFNMRDYFALCSIEYRSPCDAANTNLPVDCVDCHFSLAVLEHVPLNSVKNILREGNRFVKKEGIFFNSIDYSDHYSHVDSSISAINFLRYSDSEWRRYNNKYQWVNRLRHDDFIAMFDELDHEIILQEHSIDERSAKLLMEGFAVDKRFATKNHDILSIRGATFVTKKMG